MGQCAGRGKTSSVPCGLPNLGNTCYLNSLLQALYYSSTFRSVLSSGMYNDRLCTAFQRLFAEPETCLVEIMREVDGEIDGKQHCAHALYCKVMRNLEGNRRKKVRGANKGAKELVEEWREAIGPELFSHFGCLQQITYTCQSCRTHRSSCIFSYSLSLPLLLPPPISLQDCFTSLQQTELMTDTNTMLCPHCTTPTQHYKQSKIIHTPSLLVLHFQRYDENSGGKSNVLVSFPSTLVLTNTVGSREEYQIHAVVHHQGTLDMGHYWVDVEVKGQWWRLDDLRTIQISFSSSVQTTSYLLFYTRT